MANYLINILKKKYIVKDSTLKSAKKSKNVFRETKTGNLNPSQG